MAHWKDKDKPNRSYSLVPYQESWALDFQQIAVQIRPFFSKNFIALHHIGSTSVPSMLAKPQIDVLVVVKSLRNIAQTKKHFTDHGYTTHGDYVGQNEEYFTLDDQNGNRMVSIHVLEQGNQSITAYLTLRNYLRTSEKARLEYTHVKKKLHEMHGADNYNAYLWGKDEFIAKLLERAKKWQEKNST